MAPSLLLGWTFGNGRLATAFRIADRMVGVTLGGGLMTEIRFGTGRQSAMSLGDTHEGSSMQRMRAFCHLLWDHG
jgi:hypothetical protein